MQDTLKYLIDQIVDHPEDVIIDSEANGDKLTLTIHTNPADLGRIIGKGGRIIRAIRDLIKLMAVKENSYVDILLAEE